MLTNAINSLNVEIYTISEYYNEVIYNKISFLNEHLDYLP